MPDKNSRKPLLIAAALVLVAVAVWKTRDPQPVPTRLSFSTFLDTVQKQPQAFQPGSLVIVAGGSKDGEITGRWRKDGAPFSTTAYVDERLLERLARAKLGFEMVAAPEGGSSWSRLLITIFPLAVLAVFFLILLRQLQGGPGGPAMRMGGSRAKLVAAGQSPITFADVAGVEEARSEVEEIIAFLRDPPKFTRLGGHIPKGVLMMGPPGTGKTLLARAIAGEAGVPFFSISGSDFVEMFVGVGASRVRALFEEGKKNAPCIIFIDEIDAVGRQRGSGLGGGHDEREQTLNQLLVEMDGFESNAGVILIAATNRPDVLDPALLRAGRFDRRMVVPRPDMAGRRAILAIHTRKTPLAEDVDLAVIARGTPGLAGADLANLVNEAALLAGRGEKDRLEMHHFEMARDKVLMGAERRSMVVSARDRRETAYHEAGHALVGKLMKAGDPIHKVTIIPRGRALGLTQQLPSEDRLNLSREAADDQIAFLLAGRVAEEMVFGHLTTGASDDLQAATQLARRMVCQWGMSDRLGPISLAGHERAMLLGRAFGEGRHHSEHTASEIDQEVRRIVLGNQERARRIVLEHPAQLQAIAEALLELETIDGAELGLLMTGGKVDRAPFPAPCAPVDERAGPVMAADQFAPRTSTS